MFGRLFGKTPTVSDGPVPAASVGAPAAGPLIFGDRKRKRSALFGACQAHAEPAPSPVPTRTAARPSTPASAAASAQTSSEPASEAPRCATPAAQAAAELGAFEALYALAPELRGQPPSEVFRTYQEARRTAGRMWSVMMHDLGITEDSPPDARHQAAQDARDHPLYEKYLRARALRDAAVLAIADDLKNYKSHIGQNPNSKIGFEADLRVALGQRGARQAEQKARAVLAARYGVAGRPQTNADDDPARLKPRFGRLADVREIQEGKGVVGTIVQDYGKGPFDFIAFGRPSGFLKRLNGRKVKVLGNPDERDPSRFRIYFVFPCEKDPRDVQAR
jgi:hypothetical protein